MSLIVGSLANRPGKAAEARAPVRPFRQRDRVPAVGSHAAAMEPVTRPFGPVTAGVPGTDVLAVTTAWAGAK